MVTTSEFIPIDHHDPHALESEAETFIAVMAHALATYGTAAHRLENALSVISERLGLEGQFFTTPTAVFLSLRVPGRRAETTLMRVHPGEVHLEKMVQLDEILVDVEQGAIDPGEGTRRVRSVLSARERYGSVSTLISFSAASGCAARFFGGGVGEIVAGLVAGGLIGVIILAASRGRDIARLIEFICGLTIAFGAVAWSRLVAPISPEILMFAGLIVLFPGLTLTMAVNELAARHLSSGTSRMMSALTIFVSIGFGVAIGSRLADMVFGSQTLETAARSGLPEWTLYLAVALAPLGLTVLFRARPVDAPALVISGLIAFVGARLGTLALGPELGACVGAGLMGLYANLYSRVARRPAAVPSIVGVMLLVPGSLGFRSVSSFLEHDALVGTQTAFTALIVAVSIVVGFLLANVAIPPRRAI